MKMSKSKKQSTTIKGCLQDRIFDGVNTVNMAVMLIVFSWPLWFVLIASISDPTYVWSGEVLLLPKGINFEGYKEVFEYSELWIGYRNTILYTIIGTIINVVLTVTAAFPLSQSDFPARKVIFPLLMFTMYFNGGLIPTFLVVQKLHMVNTFWAMIIPNAVTVFNIIIAKTYFQNSIPNELREASELDGASTLKYLTSIVLPLSKPIIAVIALYYGVSHWNSFFNALIYISEAELKPLQLFLRDILISGQMMMDSMEADPEAAMRAMQLAETMKYNVIIVSALPMLCVYPFIQRFFVKGVMIGAVKG